jgi:hypothetical protein
MPITAHKEVASALEATPKNWEHTWKQIFETKWAWLIVSSAGISGVHHHTWPNL